MRVIPPILAGLMALAAPSVQAAAPNPNENWRPLNPPQSLSLGDYACDGWHQVLRRDWRGDWWWVRACPIDDLVPLGGRLNGLGA